ncbi:MAG: CPBP family intramembrane metalloprotease [Phycisphaerae bacterium]|nr:CPBP family intramembrane metalloprotease [Phycisphaerae bacterium]
MIAIPLLLAVPVIMWLVQTGLLIKHGLHVRFRIDAGDSPPIVRSAGRIVTQISLASLAIVYPYCIGRSPIAYYAELLPFDAALRDAVRGCAATTLFLCLLYLAWLLNDRLRVPDALDVRRTARRIALVPLSAAFGATVEEMVFRGVVMADLQRSGLFGMPAVVAISAIVFAAAHYVRSPKRYWTVAGHLVLGCFLSIAFAVTGNLWLAIGLHAGGILMIMGARPVLKTRGPSWLTGASIYPYAGVVGAVGLTILTVLIARRQ